MLQYRQDAVVRSGDGRGGGGSGTSFTSFDMRDIYIHMHFLFVKSFGECIPGATMVSYFCLCLLYPMKIGVAIRFLIMGGIICKG